MRYTLVRFLKLTPRVLTLLSVFILFTQCSTYRFFQHGEVELTNKVETLPIDFSNELPIIKVEINGKTYHFLIDTGAPTVISSKIYKELNLKPEINKKVSDSQGQKQSQIFTLLPEMKVGGIIFTDIPTSVVDWTQNQTLACWNIDGVLGANQMEGAFWKFNYNEEKVEVTKDLSHFDVAEYEYEIPFEPRLQKTPLVEMKLFDKMVMLTFDTGSNGKINIAKIPDKIDTLNKKLKIETYGINSIGVYGASKPTKNYIFQTDSVKIGNLPFDDIILHTGNSSTIGNELLKDFIFILDWKENNIYLKRINNKNEDFSSFGFGYLFTKNTAVVSYVYQLEQFPLEVGDTIISINNHNFENLNEEQVCEYSMNRIEKDITQMDIEIKRKEEVLKFHLGKNSYFK